MAENENFDIEEGSRSLPAFFRRLVEEDVDTERRRFMIKVPPYISRFNSDAYMPRVVSIGPYHHGKEHLRSMEARKRRCVSSFMKRSGCNPQRCYDRFRELTPQLMQYYEHLDTEWRNEDKFLELMVVDGCFLLEYFSSRTLPDGDPAKDILLGMGSVGSNLKRDLLLIENQLPIQVIRQLYSLGDQCRVIKDIENIILDFFRGGQITTTLSCLHVLDVYRKGVLRQIGSPLPHKVRCFPGPPFPSAMDLSRTGVKFKVIRTYGLVDIHFDNERGFLSLPCIIVDEDTETLFLNLMALEKLDIMERNGVSSYVAFMGLLIRSAKDVKVLRSRRIIVSEESDDVIARIFNELGKNPVNDPDNCLYVVRSDLARWSNSYIRKCNERLVDWGTNFLQTYCKNPWTAIGLVAGAILLVATVTQAAYAVLQYYQDDLSLAPPNAYRATFLLCYSLLNVPFHLSSLMRRIKSTFSCWSMLRRKS